MRNVTDRVNGWVSAPREQGHSCPCCGDRSVFAPRVATGTEVSLLPGWALLWGLLCAVAPISLAALPAAVTNQPILFVVRNQYQTDHHNTHTMFPSATNEISNGYYEGGNSALKVFDPATGGVRTILDAGANGVIRDPDVHFSGTRIVSHVTSPRARAHPRFSTR